MPESIRITREECARVLQRAGYPPEVIKELIEQLPEVIDVDRDASILSRYGVTRGRLMEAMGSSP